MMWKAVVLPAWGGQEPLHGAVDGVCRTGYPFRDDTRCTMKHS